MNIVEKLRLMQTDHIPELGEAIAEIEHLRRKTADEAEIWAADRIEELERELATTLSLLNYASDKALGTRRECDALLADNERLREALEHLIKGALSLPRFAGQEAEEALAATPAQSLARLRNQVMEECAKVCEWQTEGFAATSTWDEAALSCAKAIRATKEPE